MPWRDGWPGIEEGAECARLAPLLSALADGEADAATVAHLRPHLKTCLSCRARLREYRAAPSRVAALVPAAAFASGPGTGRAEALLGWTQQKAEALLATAHHKAAALGERAQTAAELVTGQKLAALAASAAALAGGGTAVDQFANHHGPPRPAAAIEQQASDPPAAEPPAPGPPTPPPPTTTPPPTSEEVAAQPPAEPAPPPPEPASEFDAAALPASPTAGPAAIEPLRSVPARSSRSRPSARQATGEFAP